MLFNVSVGRMRKEIETVWVKPVLVARILQGLLMNLRVVQQTAERFSLSHLSLADQQPTGQGIGTF